MLAKYPLVSRLTLLVVLPVLLAGGVAYSRLLGSVPMIEGTVSFQGLTAEVSVDRDQHGVPRIVAKTDRDAFMAMGYVHAQDRLWQLELQRRAARGRLSEIFGKQSISQDIWFRTLGLERSAR